MKILPIIIFFIILLGTDFFAFWGLKNSLFAEIKIFSYAHLATSIVTYAGLGLMIFSMLRGNVNQTVFQNTVTGLMFSFVVAKFLMAVLFLGEDIFRVIFWTIKSFINDASITYPQRSKIFGITSLSVGAFFIFILNYGVIFGKYNFKVHHKQVYFSDLPTEFDGFRIAQLSDLHLGTFDNIKRVEKGLQMLQAQNPDLIVFTGDMVTNHPKEAEIYIDIFKNLHAPYGKYTVWGNHDYSEYQKDAEQSQQKLVEIEIKMGFAWLENKSVELEKNGQKIQLVGVEDWGLPPFPQYGDLEKATQNLSNQDFTVLLSHDPTHWREVVLNYPKKIHITLSGHTHGMQFGIEIGKFKWSPVQWKYKDWADLYEKDGKYLYVNRGFGCVGYPGRVGIMPEITIIELKKLN